MLILGQKPYFLGPTIFKIPQPNWHYYICKFEVEINEIRNFYKIGAEFQDTPLSIIGHFFA